MVFIRFFRDGTVGRRGVCGFTGFFLFHQAAGADKLECGPLAAHADSVIQVHLPMPIDRLSVDLNHGAACKVLDPKPALTVKKLGMAVVDGLQGQNQVGLRMPPHGYGHFLE